jgi:glycosyltransferase involved in cell wall biosynthesis
VTTKRNLLFNFSSSPIGAGFKRLYEYAKYFNGQGGATFLIHPRCNNPALSAEFPHNRFYVISQSPLQRLINDSHYLDAIIADIGTPDLYYAYGIPMYRPIARVNWFHLTNVLTLTTRGIPLNLGFRLKIELLGLRVRKSVGNADVVSAESRSSLQLMSGLHTARTLVSENGSDDEIEATTRGSSQARENIAVAVGTYRYKALDDTYRIFQMLREQNPGLSLVVIGDSETVPRHLRRDPDVELTGLLRRAEVIARLKTARFYISTTRVENSYNAASEGAYLVEDAYVSDIPPHVELLRGVPYESVTIPGTNRKVLHVRRTDLHPANIRSWQDVIESMLGTFEVALAERTDSVTERR